MADNQYSTLTEKLVTKLLAQLAAGYSGLVVERKHFKPDALPAAFDRYGIIISPNARPWDERRTAIREVQYLYRVDIFCLVRNYHETNSLFGTTAPDLGLFQLVKDVKDYLRTATLDDLLDKTYDEPGGDARAQGGGGLDFQEAASPGLSAGNYPMVHRMKIPFVGRTAPFCHAKA